MRVQWLSMTACAWFLLSACGPRSRTIDSDTDRIPDAGDTGPYDGDGPFDADVDGLRDADIDDDGVPCVPGCDGGLCGPGEWVMICAGTFMMGSPQDEPGRDDEAETQHLVTLTHDFVILSTEVTQREFVEVMGYNPSYDASCGLECPVDGWVDWNAAEAFCNALSDTEGLERCYEGCEHNEHDGTVYWSCQYRMDLDSVYHCEGYRLPTEAEWEYAARAGTSTATYNGDIDVDPDTCEPSAVLDPIAWWCGNTGVELSDRRMHEVARRAPNSWGLYDMLGNVLEWTHGSFEDFTDVSAIDPCPERDPETRTGRGGIFWTFRQPRAAARSNPGIIGRGSGFRPARTISP